MPLYWLIEQHGNLMRCNSANENACNISLVRQLTDSWLNVAYVGKMETRIWLVAALMAKLT